MAKVLYIHACFLWILIYGAEIVDANCGANYTNDYGGSFSVSILENGNNPDNCIVRVNVTEGKLAVIRLKNLNMEVDGTCSKDYIEVRDGNSASSPLIRRYCDTNVFTVAGTSNHLYLRVLNTGTDPPYLTFNAEYFAYDLENARLNSTIGSYTSPRYQGPTSLGYPNNMDYVITVMTPAETGIIITFTEFALEQPASTKCFDFVEIWEPDGTNMGTFCGNTPPADIVTQSNVVYLRFKSNSVRTFTGFTFTWETCGAHYTQSDGIMTLPTKQSYYRNNMNCHFLFSQPIGKKIALTFDTVRLEDVVNGQCVDYIQILEGGHDSTDTIYRGCATINPFSIVSRSNEMLLRFVSDSRGLSTGFSAAYKAVDVCDYRYRSMGGEISSPSYKGQYAANEHCVYEIETTPNSRIMSYYDTFLLERRNPECHDFLEIEDPLSITTQTKKYCGGERPTTPMYTGNKLKVRFQADDTIQDKGFKSYWAACGGLHEEHFGTITAPFKYLVTDWKGTCLHTIKPKQFEKIYVMMEATHSPSGTCQDSVSLIEEVNGANATLWSLPCTTKDDGDGFIRKLFQGTQLMLRFDMDLGRTQSVDYTFSWTACGARITSRTGTIQSPFHPGYYPITQSCSYIIDASSGSNVILDFTDLDLVEGSDCEDSITIYDGINSNGRLLQYIRGSTLPSSIVSSSSRMFIKFNPTCSHVSGKGFSAKWQVCGAITSEEDGDIITPGYPKNYVRNIRCMYTITTVPGKIVSIQFEDFSVGSNISNECTNDYLEVSDGFFLQSTYIGKFCGGRSPFVINSTSNTLNLLLVSTSDRNLGYRGYKAHFRSLIKSEISTTTEASSNTTVVYSYIQDPEYLSDAGVVSVVVLALIAVILIAVVVILCIILHRKKPPLIIPEQKIVIPAPSPSPGKRNDELLNFRENTHLIDIYKGVNSKSPTLQEQLRDRRRSTGFLPRDIYSQPHRHRNESINEMESELGAPPMTEIPDADSKLSSVTEFDGDMYAKVNRKQEKGSEHFGTFGKKKGFNNDTYADGELSIRESADAMYL